MLSSRLTPKPTGSSTTSRPRPRRSGSVKEATPDTNEILEVLITIEDNGRPQNGESRDHIGFAPIEDETPDEDPPSEQDNECVAPVPQSMSRLTQGDFTVRDVQP